MSTPEDQNGPSQATETPEQRLERMLQAYDAAAVAPNADAGRHLHEILAADGGLRRNVLKAIAENDLNAIAVEPAGGAGVRGYDVASRTLYVPAATLQAAADTDRDARKDATELVKDRVKTASLSPGDRLDRLLDDYRDAIFDPRAAPPSDRGRIDRQIDAYNLKLGEYYNTIKPPLAAADRPLLEKNDSTRAWYAGQVREHLKEVLTSDTIKATVLARIESGEVSSFTVPPEKDTAGFAGQTTASGCSWWSSSEACKRHSRGPNPRPYGRHQGAGSRTVAYRPRRHHRFGKRPKNSVARWRRCPISGSSVTKVSFRRLPE